jgi:hypothetical protein
MSPIPFTWRSCLFLHLTHLCVECQYHFAANHKARCQSASVFPRPRQHVSVIDPCSDASAIIPGIDCFAQIRSPCSEVLCQFAVIEQLWPFSEDQFGGYDQGCFLVELQEQVELDHLLVESSCHDCISVI